MRTRGFTLIEMMVTIAILAILVGVAAPSFRAMSASQRIKTVSFDLHADLTFARSESIKRNANVTVAPNAGGWSTGWRISATGVADALLVRELPVSTVSLTASAASVIFNRSGRPSTALNITAADADTSITARCVELDLSGRAATKKGSC